jgi:hypothetical protein
MKFKLLIVALAFTFNLYSNEIDTLKLNSKIKEVTVFIDGAQITREAKIAVLKGKHIFVLENLPAEINPQSIQIDNNQQGEILSVKHELVYPTEKSKTVIAYEDKIRLQKISVLEIQNEIKVYELEEKILLDNSKLNKKDEGSSVAVIKEAAAFYRTKLNEIRQNQLNLKVELDLQKEKIQDLYLELNKYVSHEKKTTSKIVFAVNSAAQINANFRISYFVSSAGWTPLYDFRVNDIHEPLNLIYNANIYQSTGEDWNGVNLTLSTNRPTLSNIMPQLETWFIERKNSYQKNNVISEQSALRGNISDVNTGDPIPFANLIVYNNGEVVAATTTDFDGRYSIKPINPGYYDVIVSFVGYESTEIKGVQVNAGKITFQDFKMQAAALSLDEVQIAEYKVPLINKVKPRRVGSVTAEEIAKLPERKANSRASTVAGIRGSRADEIVFVDGYEPNSTITGLEYKIDVPYTIPSDGKDYNVKIKEAKIPVNFVFRSVPKLDNDVFLIAEISDWSKLNLLSGKSSIYYNGVFTGQSEIDVKNIKDTLAISLNREKNILVERTLLKEKNEKQFIGNNIRETINWSITVKNNKTVRAKVFIEDQFPVSENKSIEIERLEDSNGRVNEKTGKIIWELNLEPNEKKELTLKYSVKYPNHMRLYVD